MLILQAHHQFIEECKNGMLLKRSHKTLENYLISFRLFMNWTKITDTSDLHEGFLRQFFNKGESERNWKPATVVSHRKNLSPFFKWCVNKNILQENPLSKIPQQKILKNLPDYYSDQEIDKILYQIEMKAFTTFERKRNKAIFAVFCLAGLRKGELINLKVCDLDFVEGVIRLRAENTKNRYPRVVKMNYKLKEILEDYWRVRLEKQLETNYFWLSSTYKSRYTEHGLKHLIKRLSRQIGFQIKPHKMRHTFATKFYQGSQDILSLQQILGHQDLKTTTIYAHLIPENTKVSLDKNPLNSIF